MHRACEREIRMEGEKAAVCEKSGKMLLSGKEGRGGRSLTQSLTVSPGAPAVLCPGKRRTNPRLPSSSVFIYQPAAAFVKSYLFYVYEYLPAYAPCVCPIPPEIRRGHQIPWSY